MNTIIDELMSLADSTQAQNLSRFFKTGKGQYGEGDKFLGIKVPIIRKVVREHYKTTTLESINKLINHKYHEIRLCGLLILVAKFEKEKNDIVRKKYYEYYLTQTKNINNWDLVDLSAPNIVGKYLLEKDKSILNELAKSENLWEKRISILSTFAFIRNNDFDKSLEIIFTLINDKNDLIHKATGWMLREIGKRNKAKLLLFLDKNKLRLPRTTLRYAIEHFDKNEKEFFMKK
jgi:3-methyladenine DNA glycosylase AlkD